MTPVPVDEGTPYSKDPLSVSNTVSSTVPPPRASGVPGVAFGSYANIRPHGRRVTIATSRIPAAAPRRL